MKGLPTRSRRLLTMLAATPGTVSADMLRREAVSEARWLPREVSRTRAALHSLRAPDGIETVHGLGYRLTPDLRAWVSERVPA